MHEAAKSPLNFLSMMKTVQNRKKCAVESSPDISGYSCTNTRLVVQIKLQSASKIAVLYAVQTKQ